MSFLSLETFDTKAPPWLHCLAMGALREGLVSGVSKVTKISIKSSFNISCIFVFFIFLLSKKNFTQIILKVICEICLAENQIIEIKCNK